MKRILSVLLTVALVGSMIAGVAGTAAATEKHDHKADAIDSITFYNNDDGELRQFAKATWSGDKFVVQQLDKNDDISLTTKKYNENGPVKVKWTYEGYVGAEHPDFVRVNVDGKTCDYKVDSTRYPFTGMASACEPTDGHDEHDKHKDKYDEHDKHKDKYDEHDKHKDHDKHDKYKDKYEDCGEHDKHKDHGKYDKHKDKHEDCDEHDKHKDHDKYDKHKDKHEDCGEHDKHKDHDKYDKHKDKHGDYDKHDKHKDSKTEHSSTIVNVVVTLFS